MKSFETIRVKVDEIFYWSSSFTDCTTRPTDQGQFYELLHSTCLIVSWGTMRAIRVCCAENVVNGLNAASCKVMTMMTILLHYTIIITQLTISS